MENICCICNKKFEGEGNNPYPVRRGYSLVCCDECNTNVVIPERLKQLERSKKERVEMLRAMITIAYSINNEEILEAWLMSGVADGDWKLSDDELFDTYGDDETFADIMATFVRVMRYMIEDEEFDDDDRKTGNGFLFCDRVVSKRKEI